MQTFHTAQASEPRSRVVFEDAEVSVGFPASATLVDVADWVEGVARLQDSAPVAIDVTVAASAPPIRKGLPMQRTDMSIARFAYHYQAETAVKTLAQAGFDIRQLSVVGRGYHSEENVVGFYNAGGRIRIWGNYGAFWGGLYGLCTGGVFLTSPTIGPVVALGALATLILPAVEGAIAVGGPSALGAALHSLGIPKDSVLEYEQTLKADGFLVFVHGTTEDVARAKSILATVKPTHLEIHEGVIAPAATAPVVHAAA